MDNILVSAIRGLKNIIDYNPPKNPDPFVLDEARPFDKSPKDAKPNIEAAYSLVVALTRFGERLLSFAGQVTESSRRINPYWSVCRETFC